MTVSPTAVSVLGIPKILPRERMIDKLTIHFLRPRNGGGEVLRVLYPVRERADQAFVIFEQSKVVASVLQQTHKLELDGQSFPLVVQAADLPQVDIPASAVLDLRGFPSDAAVFKVLQRHWLEVLQLRHGELLVRGTFLKLRAAQVELQQLLAQGLPHQPILQSPESVSKCQNGEMVHAGYASSIHNTKRKVAQSSARDASFGPSYSHEVASLSNRRSADRRPRRDDETSFFFDTDTLSYAQTFNRLHLQKILGMHGAQMDVIDGPNCEVCNIRLSGTDAVNAKQELQRFLIQLGTTLRTQEIPLASFGHDQEVLIGKRIQAYKDQYPVVVRQVMDTIELIGPSKESFELKQRIIGDEFSSAKLERVGRTEDRTRGRRSVSLPRQANRADLRPPESHPAGASGYSPLKYQKSEASHPTPPGESQRRRRSNSESRGEVKSDKAIAQEGCINTAPPSVDPKPAGKKGVPPQIKNPIYKDIEKRIKSKLSVKKTSHP